MISDPAIAERHLTLVSDTGKSRGTVTVRMGKPERSPDRSDFYCEVQISGLDNEVETRIYGLDAFQSLQLSVRFISTILNHYRQQGRGSIYWLKPGDDLGFAKDESQF